MAYATVAEVEAGFRTLTADEKTKCAALLEEADVLIDAVAWSAKTQAKSVVERRMVRRALGDSGSEAVPIGATQGSVSALGYSQSWQVTNGSTGELYLSKTDKSLLGLGNKIGMTDPYPGACKC